MRTLKSSHILAAFLTAFAALQPAAAQQPGADAPPPPKLEPLEEGEPPAITIRQPQGGAAVIEEQKAPGGKVTEIKVTAGGSTYYLLPNDPAGFALPGDGQSNLIRAAQWEVLQFDLGPTPAALQDAAAQAAEGSPPPPTGK